MNKSNAYDALIRRLEMTLARQKLSVTETELQLEAARAMRDGSKETPVRSIASKGTSS